jgi:ubiquitin carboxyl-terminal hydrolase 10
LRRRRRINAGDESVELPPAQQAQMETAPVTGAGLNTDAPPVSTPTPKASPAPKLSSLAQPSTRSETPSAHDPLSETGTSTAPTTPSSTQPPNLSSTPTTTTPTKAAKSAAPRAAVPAIPVVPVLPKAVVKDTKSASPAEPLKNGETKGSSDTPAPTADATSTAATEAEGSEPQQDNAQSAPAPAPVKQKPSSWAGLFNKRAAASGAPPATGQAETDGAAAEGADASPNGSSHFAQSIKSSLGEALQAYRVGKPDKISLLEPRGLVNNGNMCYMNSVSRGYQRYTSK